jgi:hypothetical protein
MNTASLSLGTRISRRWPIRCGKGEAVGTDHRRKTGSMPHKNCGPGAKFSGSECPAEVAGRAVSRKTQRIRPTVAFHLPWMVW